MKAKISREALHDLAPIYLKANRLMCGVLIMLFLSSLGMAAIHDRWVSALLIGAGAAVVPLVSMYALPAALVTRLLVASSLMVFSALQIHLLSGLIEAHFSVFILLSVLLAYRDWRTILCAAVVIALHHVVFCHLQHMGFNVYVMPEVHVMTSHVSMVLVHAGYVVVQSVALCILARQMEKDAITAEELGKLSSHIGRRQGVFDLGFGDTAMRSELGIHFKRTMLAVRSTLTRVSNSIAHVSRISADIAKGNNDLSARNERQEAVLSHTIGQLESLSKTVLDNSSHAQEANEIADDAGAVADQGRQLVEELATAMSRMRESSREISEIISIIDNIAFQTNILALNAAVEAARAGESGRGFAVVASEVRTLAQKSATASHDIRELIDASQQQVLHSTSKADNVAENMNNILSFTKKLVLLMNDISMAGREQSSGINEVSSAVNNIGDATRENGALVDDVANVVASLRQQVDELSRAVQVFELGGSKGELETSLPYIEKLQGVQSEDACYKRLQTVA